MYFLYNICTKGLTVSGYFVQNKAGSVQKNDDSVQNHSDKSFEMCKFGLDEIAKLKENLLRQEQEVQNKERRLASKEREIREREIELTEKTQKVIQEWNELLDNKEQSQQKILDKIQQNLLNEKRKDELSDKVETIKKLKQENIQLKDEIIKALRKIDQQTEKNVIFDYIVPFLPSVISIIGFFLTNRKIDDIQELSPVQEEIGNITKKLSDTDKKKLFMKLEESLKTFTAQPVPVK